MDAEVNPRSLSDAQSDRPKMAWHDLRGWLEQVERHGALQRIAAPVDTDEEIGAVTLLATQQDRSPALLFETMRGDATNSRILTNMLGASKERYALAVGLDPSLGTAEMIEATRLLWGDPIEPVTIPRDRAPVNEVVLAGANIDLTRFPVPKFWPGDGGRFIGSSRKAAHRIGVCAFG